MASGHLFCIISCRIVSYRMNGHKSHETKNAQFLFSLPRVRNSFVMCVGDVLWFAGKKSFQLVLVLVLVMMVKNWLTHTKINLFLSLFFLDFFPLSFANKHLIYTCKCILFEQFFFLAFGLASVDNHLNANIFFLLKPLLFRSLFLISVHVLDSLFLLFFHRKFTAHRIRKLPTTTICNGTSTRTNTKIYLCPHTQQPQNNALIRSRSCRRFFPTFHFSIFNFFFLECVR